MVARDDAVALAPRRAYDDGRALVPGAELARRDEPDAVGEQVPQRAVPDDHAREPVRRLDELGDALLVREAADVEDVRRILGLAHRLRERDARGHDAHLARPEPTRGLHERRRGADQEPRATHEPAESPGRLQRELGVRAPELHDERPPGRERGERRDEPVRVHEVGVACGPPRGPGEREQEERDEEYAPRLPPQVPGDPVPVREPEVPERGGRDDRDLDARRAQVLDRVPHERARDVVLRARVRRRQDGELHGARAARPKTTGRATASAAKT
jgi:hypothetical protein